MQTISIIHYQQQYIEALHQQIATLEPKARGYDLFLSTDGLTSMEVAAKSLGMGHHRLLGYLREKRILTQKGAHMRVT